MFRNVRRCTLLFAAVLLTFGLVGCGEANVPKGKVTGTVSFNGKPVKDGYIVFHPTDGKGSDSGGPIVDGAYTLSAVPVGQKTVTISSGEPPAKQDRPISSEEASKLKTPDPKKTAEHIPGDAKGNNTKVEVKTGDQSFDFALKS